MDYDSIREELLKNDKEFRQLSLEHQDCEDRLQELAGNSLAPFDYETRAKPIKLHKLALKDRMESLIRAHASTS